MKQGFLISTDEGAKPYTFVICEPTEVAAILAQRSELEIELDNSDVFDLSNGKGVVTVGSCEGYREDEEEEDEYTYEQEFRIIPYDYLAREGDKHHVHVQVYGTQTWVVVGYNTLEELMVALRYVILNITDFSFVSELDGKVIVEYCEEVLGRNVYVTLTKMEVEAPEVPEPSYVQVTLDDGEELGIFLNGDIGGDSLYTRIRSAQICGIGHDANKYTIEEIYIR